MQFLFIFSCFYLTFSIFQYSLLLWQAGIALERNPFSKFTLKIGFIRLLFDIAAVSFFVYYLVS